MRKYLLVLIWSMGISAALAHEAGEMSIRVGPDQGVLEYSKEFGFKLNPLAEKRFQLGFLSIDASKKTAVPETAWVRTLGNRGIYRKREGYLKQVHGDDLRTGDELLIAGVGFVRIIDSAFGKTTEAAPAYEDEDQHD